MSYSKMDRVFPVLSQEKTARIISEILKGMYASSTYFITDDPEPRVRFIEGDEPYTAYALFSDGIEDMALDQKAMTAHTPFFTSMIRHLDGAGGEGKDQGLSAALATFLDSDRVCERTDDDKSLILLSAA